MALFDRLAAALFGAQPAADAALVAEMTEAIVDAVEPKVRMQSRYRQKLEPHIRQSIEHLRALGREPLEPVLLSRAAWASDPQVNAFFATAADVRMTLGRSPELRSFFDQPAHAALQEAFALLGMKKEERSTLGVDDQRQTLVSFTSHRIVAPSETLAATRLEIGRRILLRLAQVSLTRILAADAKANELQSRKDYLGARMRLLRLAADGMEGIVKDRATIAAEMKAVERELTHTVEGYIAAKASAVTIEGYLEQIADVFSCPQEHVSLGRSRLRVSRLGVLVEQEAAGPVNEFDLAELAIGEFHAAIAIVRCPRAEIPSKEELIAQAERSL